MTVRERDWHNLDCNLGVVWDLQDDINNHYLVDHIFQGVGYAQPHEASADLLLDIAAVPIQVNLPQKVFYQFAPMQLNSLKSKECMPLVS